MILIITSPHLSSLNLVPRAQHFNKNELEDNILGIDKFGTMLKMGACGGVSLLYPNLQLNLSQSLTQSFYKFSFLPKSHTYSH